MAHHVDSYYDESEGIFLPPKRTLGFNPQLKINDSLLVQSYVEAYDISYPEALLRIEDEVNELKMHLQTKGFYELNDIGTLEFNENGNYVFTPCEAGILTPDLYGLCSFEMLPFKTVAPVVEEKEKEEIEDEAAQIIDISQPDQNTETPEAAADEEDEEDVVRIKFSWIRNAVAIAAILVAVIFAALPTGKTEMMTRTISNINSNLLFGMMSKDTNTSKIEINKTEISKTDIQKSTNKSDTIAKPKEIKKEVKREQVADAVPIETVKGQYCIVLASHVSRQNAEIFIDKLKAKGLDSVELYTSNKVQSIRRVVCGSYSTEEEAYHALRRIHKDEELRDAWVYKYN
jgi:cell division septation protein DedD